jgi:uncharacterized membrane protein YdbT with pleckstrin-like domain
LTINGHLATTPCTHDCSVESLMKYIDEVLQPGEKVQYTTTLHWFIYLRAVVLFASAVAFAIGAYLMVDPTIRLAMLAAAGIATAIGLLVWLSAFISRWTTELAITDRRVIYKTGLIRRHTFEMNLSKVESVGVTQSIMGRIMGFGQVEIKGTGSSLAPVTTVSRPLMFRSYITAHEQSGG